MNRRQALFGLSVLTSTLAIPGRCRAEMTIEHVTKGRAQQLGFSFRATARGAGELRVELEFETTGELRRFERVDLELRDGKKRLLTTTLQDKRPQPNRAAVAFTADPATLDKLTLMVVVAQELGGAGYELRVKDFVGPPKNP